MACLVEALRTTVAIFTILIGALLFGYFLAITQTPQKITSFLVALDLGSYGTLALILALFVLMGCVLDAMAMIILLVPIVFPVIQTLGFDPIWFGVIVVMTVELGLITPPVGMNVYVINSIVPDDQPRHHLPRRRAVHPDRPRAPCAPGRLPLARAVPADHDGLKRERDGVVPVEPPARVPARRH